MSENPTAPLLIAVMGPTASGKSDLAEALAHDLDARLLNADAFQIYRGMDIGTGKPEDRGRYDLLDLKDPDEGFGVGEYVLRASARLHELYAERRHAVVVGGTGLYVRALFEEYVDLAAEPDPELRIRLNGMTLDEKKTELTRVAPEVAVRIDLQNPARVQRALERALGRSTSLQWHLPPYRKLKLAIVPETGETETRVANRVQAMVHNGWVLEIEELRRRGFKSDDPGFRAIGYRTLLRHADGELGREEAMATTIAETRGYAKRQRTWLRSEPNLIQLERDDPLEDARRRLSFLLH
ncbi:MAG: tRNA (adenosine(37)-N6)-dimethylallyltransferase MiaA [Fimbriimonas sp.]